MYEKIKYFLKEFSKEIYLSFLFIMCFVALIVFSLIDNEKETEQIGYNNLQLLSNVSNDIGHDILFDASHIHGDMSFTLNTSYTYFLYPDTAQLQTEGAPYYGKYFYLSAFDLNGWYDHTYAKIYVESSSEVVRYSVDSSIGDIGVYEFVLDDFELTYIIKNGGWYQFVHTYLIHYDLYEYQDGGFVGDAFAFITQNNMRFNTADSSYLEGYNAGYNDGFDKGYFEGKKESDSDAWNRGYNDGYNRGLLDGYDNGYNDGFVSGEGVGFDKGYFEGKNDGIKQGYNEGYNVGYSEGLVTNPNNNFGSMILSVLLGVGAVLSIELLPNITIGAIIAVPIVFGIIAFVLGRKKD